MDPISLMTQFSGSGGSVDPLASLSDDFETGSTMTGNGWSIEDTAVTSSPSDTITSGEADLTVAAGDTNGSFWFDANDGVLWYKTVSGACDMRARIRCRNTADDGLPPAAGFRIACIAVHDPDRGTLEYLHIGVGSTNQTGNRIEWKTTDNSDSAFSDNGSDVTPLDYDLRIVRRASDLQVFDLSCRVTTGNLSDDSGWTLLQTIDRSDDQVPIRTNFGGTTAVALPSTLRWGLSVYSNTFVHDVRAFVDEVVFSTPTT